jgi:hypothetical protein
MNALDLFDDERMAPDAAADAGSSADEYLLNDIGLVLRLQSLGGDVLRLLAGRRAVAVETGVAGAAT